MIARMVQEDPVLRPSIAEIKQHVWMKGDMAFPFDVAAYFREL